MEKEEIKNWLHESGHGRAWLARQCAVSKTTVDGWFAHRAIPKPAMATIERLVRGEVAAAPQFSLDTFSKIQREATKAALSIEEYVTLAVQEKLARAQTNQM